MGCLQWFLMLDVLVNGDADPTEQLQKPWVDSVEYLLDRLSGGRSQATNSVQVLEGRL
jgi:hypothetical protein